MMRPAVRSSYSSRCSTTRVDQGRGIVGGDLLGEARDLVSGAGGQQAPARLGSELRKRFHRQAAVAVDEQAERRFAVFVGELGEDLGEVGRMLLLQQVYQVGGRTDAQQSLD
jgi:hypothetical protein